jgi:hypothetical protein
MGKFIYAIYKDDVFIDLGTREELAKRMNVSPRYINHLHAPSNLKKLENKSRYNGGHLLAIKIGEVGDELEEAEKNRSMKRG